MDMKINSKLVVAYRNKRAWSQQQLSIVAGVSLRTIQRVEKQGSASLETLKSIASAFDTETDTLIVKDAEVRAFPKKLGASLLLLISMVLGISMTSSTTAATDIEIQANTIEQSHARTVTVFSDEVRIFIPQDVEFELSGITHDKAGSQEPYQLQFITDDLYMMLSDARITNQHQGTTIVAQQAKALK